MPAAILANGTESLMFNGGSHFKFTPGISLFVKSKDRTLLEQVPRQRRPRRQLAGCRTSGASPGRSFPARRVHISAMRIAKANRALQAMLKMKKIVVADLDAAANG